MLTYKEVVDCLSSHFSCKPKAIVQRSEFNGWYCKLGESIADFCAELRRLVEHCKFGTVSEDVLRDRLVCSIAENMQWNLLNKETLMY